LLLLSVLLAPPVYADELDPVVVTATRVAQRSRDLPLAIDSVGRAQIAAGQLEVNLSEALQIVPGLSIENRQNYAQDLQLSIRGFGARSSFGVRGVRLFSDGIPGTMPDGQGQFSQFDLGSADHIEVLRGPFSALYGNSSGGVISVFTQDGPPGNVTTATLDVGSLATQRYALEDAGEAGALNYVLDASHFQTDGYREHSAAQRNLFNSKFKIDLGTQGTLTLVGNVIDTPFIDDALGLTQAQLYSDREQAGIGAIAYDTRKSLAQEQAGAIYDRSLNADDDLQATVYAGHRHTVQFQAIPAASERSPADPGGVIDLARNFYGVDIHLDDHRVVFGMPLRVTAGVAYDDLEEARTDYQNFVGAELGVQGALRIDEANHVYDADQYLQAEWDPVSRWRVLAGVRNNEVYVTSHDHLPVQAGDADTGVHYGAVDPVGGVTFRANDRVNAYASYGKGFETPTLNDLAYRSTNGSLPGLNLGLEPAHSDNYEVGVKAAQGGLRADLDAFYIKTEHELAVEQNSNGRAVYQNIGSTQRRGLELSMESQWPDGLMGRLGYTYLHAITAEAYRTCVGVPCVSATVPAGNYIPALARNALDGSLTWQRTPGGVQATVETQGRARIFADDRDKSYAPGFWVTNVRVGWTQAHGAWQFSEFLRLDNVFDRYYVDSVIVNDSNSRYFEPDPGRTIAVVFTAARGNQ
jgi:iron complex outermembrane receptor protein